MTNFSLHRAASGLRDSGDEQQRSVRGMAMHIYSVVSATFFVVAVMSGCTLATTPGRVTESDMAVSMVVYLSSVAGALWFGWMANSYFTARRSAVEAEMRQMRDEHDKAIEVLTRRLEDAIKARNGK